MTPDLNSAAVSAHRSRRAHPLARAIRLASRGLLIISAVILIAAVLPAVTPRRWLARTLARVASEDWGLPVSVAAAEWNWWQGFVLRVLRIGLQEKPAVVAQAVTLDAKPWDLLITGEIRQVSLEEVTCKVLVGYDGSLALDTVGASPDAPASTSPSIGKALKAPPSSRTAPKFSITHFTVNDCVLIFRDSRSGRSGTIRLTGLTARLDRRSGLVQWKLTGTAGRGGLFASEGRLVVPRLTAAPAELNGEAKLLWRAIRLDAIPPGLIARFGLAEVTGEMWGDVDLWLNSEWVLAGEAQVGARQLALRDATGHQISMPEVTAAVSGQWRMMEQQVRLAKVDLTSPTLRLRAVGPALVYDGQAGRLVRANAFVELQDIPALADAVRRLGVKLPETLKLGGRCTISARVRRQNDASAISWRLSGEAVSVDWPGIVARSAGEPLDIEALCTFYDDGHLMLESGKVRSSGAEVSITGELALRTGSPTDRVALNHASVDLRWKDLSSFLRPFVPLARILNRYGRLVGPGRARIWTSASAQGGFNVGATCWLPEVTEASFGEWFAKPGGISLQIDLKGSIGKHLDRLSIERVNLAASDATVAEVNQVVVTASQIILDDEDVEKPRICVEMRGLLGQVDMSRLGRFCPKLAEFVKQFGSVTGRVEGQLALRSWADISGRRLKLVGVTAAGELDFSGAELVLSGLVEKPDGRKLRLSASGSYWQDQQDRHGWALVSVEADGLAGQIVYEARPDGTGPERWCWGWLYVDDLGKAASALPALRQAVQNARAQGGLRGQWEWARWVDSFELRSTLDLTGLAVHLDQPSIGKPAGLPAKLELNLSGPISGKPTRGLNKWRLTKAELRLGECRASISDAELEVAEPWSTLISGQGRRAVWRAGAIWPIRQAAGKVSGVITIDEGLASLSESLRAWLRRQEVCGVLKWTMDGRYELGSGIELAVQVDADDVAINTQPIVKARGVPLRASAGAKARLIKDDQGELVAQIEVREATGEAAGVVWSGQAGASVRLDAKGAELLAAEVAATAISNRLQDLAKLIRPAEQLTLHGSAGLAGRCKFDKQGGWQIESLEIGCWPAEWQLLGVACKLEGLLRFKSGFVEAAGLVGRIGRTAGRATLHATWDGPAVTGQVATIFDRIDVDELQLLYNRSTELLKRKGGPGLVTPQIDLRRSKVRFVGRSDLVLWTIRPDAGRSQIEGLGWKGTLQGGSIHSEAVGEFEGGSLVVRLSGPFASDEKAVQVHYTLEKSLPTEQTRMLVERSFPGLRVAGPVTRIETLPVNLSHLSAPSIPGKGEMIVEGGEVRGRAAPAKIAQLFPGLKLARFKFHRLHLWFERDSQGKTTNRMIFRSVPWSLYVNGWSLLDGRFQYEVGIDLLGPFESEYWAEADKGRIALFTKTGRVVDGRIEDEVVRYLSPQEVLARILKDNVLTVTYHLIRQQVIKQRTGGR